MSLSLSLPPKRHPLTTTLHMRVQRVQPATIARYTMYLHVVGPNAAREANGGQHDAPFPLDAPPARVVRSLGVLENEPVRAAQEARVLPGRHVVAERDGLSEGPVHGDGRRSSRFFLDLLIQILTTPRAGSAAEQFGRRSAYP